MSHAVIEKTKVWYCGYRKKLYRERPDYCVGSWTTILDCGWYYL